MPPRKLKRSWYLKVILIVGSLALTVNFYLVAKLFAYDITSTPLSAYINGERISERLIFRGQCNASRYSLWTNWTNLDLQSYLLPTVVLAGSDPFAVHQFDQRTSDSVAIDREVPDTRHATCPRHYDFANLRNAQGQYPSVSIIITFHNEARSTLLRTIVSVLRRTRREFLCEIVLIDDFSDNKQDGDYLAGIEFVTVLRNERREGLVRSRNRGALYAHGDVLVFLDSHCEANQGWLEPLLEALIADGERVLSPIIDVIDQSSFSYQETESSLRGAFDWDLVFKWEQLPGPALMHHRQYPTEPFATPMFAGGLFAISRSYFFQLGAYDPEMSVWGGENVEMSLRVWQCGGRLEIVPCSRVGHVFRSAHPYTFPGGGSAFIFARNMKRAAEIWLDEFRTLFYERNPTARAIDAGVLDDRRKLRDRLHCKPFRWFLSVVFPELRLPPGFNSVLTGTARNAGALAQGSFCIAAQTERDDPEGVRRNSRRVGLTRCNPNDQANIFEFDESGTLHQPSRNTNTKMCLTVVEARELASVYLSACVTDRSSLESQRWMRVNAPNEDGSYVFRAASSPSMCLASHTETGGSPRVIVEPCDPTHFSQRWRFRVRESVR